jgi:hypothetical protein
MSLGRLVSRAVLHDADSVPGSPALLLWLPWVYGGDEAALLSACCSPLRGGKGGGGGLQGG